MPTIGIFTVGGSPDPIINAIKENNFDFIYFICSSGSASIASERLVDGSPQRPDEKIIVKECNLPRDKYEKILLDIDIVDDVEEIFKNLEIKLIRDMNNRFPDKRNLEVIANYTGGTKTMSVALALLSIFQEGWKLQINTATRSNVIKIERGDHPVFINKIQLLYRLEKKEFDSLMSKYYYEEILERLRSYLRYEQLGSDTKKEILLLIDIMEAFISWDKFQHKDALDKLETVFKAQPKDSPIKKNLTKYFLLLKKILGQMKPFHGYEKVIDLVYNAERRSAQERYDDALARYYRAVEMVAQYRLKLAYEIDNSNIRCQELSLVEEKLRKLSVNVDEAIRFLQLECNKNSEDGVLKLALTKSYELLGYLGDPIGKIYLERKGKILDCLKLRNNSILAHGTKPILKSDFEEVKEYFYGFIRDALRAIGIEIEKPGNFPQFPKNLAEIGLGGI